MSRSINDRRVRKIISAIDHAIASPHADVRSGIVHCVASSIISLGSSSEDFAGWSDNATRAVLIAYALNAPADELTAMAHEAVRQHAWVDWWNAEGCHEAGECTHIADKLHGVKRAA